MSYAPGWIYRSQTDNGLKRGAIHERDNAQASGVVLPKNVRLAVPVKVARTSNAPGWIYRSQTDNGLKRGAIHERDNAQASGVVLPKNVRLAVPVEVFVCARNSPSAVAADLQIVEHGLVIAGVDNDRVCRTGEASVGDVTDRVTPMHGRWKVNHHWAGRID